MFWTLTPAPRRPSMSRTNYDESFYYSAARLDALDRRHARANEHNEREESAKSGGRSRTHS